MFNKDLNKLLSCSQLSSSFWYQFIIHHSSFVIVTAKTNETFTAIQSKSLSKDTAAMYLRRKLHFIKWLQTNHPMVGDVAEVNLEHITTEMMCNYIDQLSKKPDGSLKTISTPEAVYSVCPDIYV